MRRKKDLSLSILVFFLSIISPTMLWVNVTKMFLLRSLFHSSSVCKHTAEAAAEVAVDTVVVVAAADVVVVVAIVVAVVSTHTSEVLYSVKITFLRSWSPSKNQLRTI